MPLGESGKATSNKEVTKLPMPYYFQDWIFFILTEPAVETDIK